MKRISHRMLLLVGGSMTLLALLLCLLTVTSLRSYYNYVLMHRASQFAQRIVDNHPDLFTNYQAKPGSVGIKLREYVLSDPNTGLFLLDSEGKVLASSGEGKIFWSSYRVDLSDLRQARKAQSTAGVFGQDPDSIDGRCLVSGYPVIQDGKEVAWIYIVARDADRPLPEGVGNYAIRVAVWLALFILATAALVAWAIHRQLVLPLARLTSEAQSIANKGDVTPLNLDDACRADEVGQLSRSFGQMLGRLQLEQQRVLNNDEQRRIMVQSIAHDLRTPLTALTGQIETIQLKPQLTDAEKANYLRGAFSNAQQIKRLIDSLAELALLDAPEANIERHPTDIGDLISDSLQRISLKSAQQQVEIVCDYPDGLPLVNADARLIERAIANLLDNALRVTPSRGIIRVGVSALASGVLQIDVEDSGPGIAPDERQRIFERFYQGSRSRSERGSAGLGLSIVKRVAELHQGSIAVIDIPRETALGGACFRLSLPTDGAN